MSRKADPKRIGLFVVGAFALALACVMVFGGRNLFAPTERFVLYFEGSVAGLQVGAPVNFRGVRLGQVTNIGITFLPGTRGNIGIYIPVDIELDPSKIQGLTVEHKGATQQMIDHGLRAELGMQSFVTGQLSVELDFKPSTRANLTKIESRYPEIPTLPSDMEKLKASVTRLADLAQELPLEEIAEKIETAITATSDSVVQISKAVDAVSGRITPLVDDITATVTGIRQTVEEARNRLAMKPGEVFQIAADALVRLKSVADTVSTQIAPLAATLDATMGQARTTLGTIDSVAQNAGTVIQDLGGDIGPLATNVQETLAAARIAVEKTQTLLDTLDREAGPFIADARLALTSATETLNGARGPIENVGNLAASLDTRLDPLLQDASAAMASARSTLDNSDAAIGDIRTMIAQVSSDAARLMTKADGVLDSAQGATDDARSAIQGVGSLVRPNSPTVAQVEATLAEVRRAATSLRRLADYLERNPSALLTGNR
ncbi:Paraquat-inducible protein B (plasmid) [Marinibacterium anthonyi]|nr:Paraquat-inducible protein B [Marinibacterium anthonyi]